MTKIIKRTRIWTCALITLAVAASASARADGPFGAPGLPHQWAPALKQAIGTAYEETGAASPVWFTLAQGILTEVYYPSPDQAQVGDLQFLVTDGESFFSEQKRDTISQVRYADDGMTVLVSGQDKSGRYSFDQQIITDSASPVVRIRTTFKWNQPGLRLFVLFKPAIGNAGAQNLAYASADGLFATHADGVRVASGRAAPPVYAALLGSAPWLTTSAGYVGFSDGWQDVSKHFHLTQTWPEAGPGNIALTGEVAVPAGTEFTYEMDLAFGANRSEATTFAKTAMAVPFHDDRATYDGGWNHYIDTLERSPLGATRFMEQSPFARRSAILIKMHEDKTHRGAIVASMSKPAVPYSEDALDGTGGYHLVWPRDLYHAAMGLMAAGDARTPVDVLHYLERAQKADGSWSQNFWIDGTPYWRGLQMDEVSFPVLLALQLDRRGILHAGSAELDMIRRAAGFIVAHGPTTPQDRWEEIGGYVPSTIAAEVAALRAATLLTGDASFDATAEQWQSQLETWTLVDSGARGKNYYLRASPSGNPNGPEPIDLANGAGTAFASEILDGGFLDLVRYGVRGPLDAPIVSTLQAYESPGTGIATPFPTENGSALTYRRYNRDQYGPDHVGGFWPLLAGERGHYAILAGDLPRAKAQLFALEASALPSGNLPEQIISPGSATSAPVAGLGVACPLVWAHAEDILLHRSIEERHVFDAPPTH